MLDGLKHWWAIRQMRRSRAAILKAYGKDVAAARLAKKSDAEIEKIQENEHHELRFVDDERDIAESRRLVSRAAHCRVPVPQSQDDWEDSIISDAVTYPGLERQSCVWTSSPTKRRGGVTGTAACNS